MRVLDKLSSMIGRNGAARGGAEGVAPERTVEIDLDEPAPGGAEGSIATTPRSRQEMVAELQRSYAEVVELVRKVDNHLDRAEERAARLMDIAERLPAALDTVPKIERATERVAEAVERLNETSRDGSERIESAVGRLTEIGMEQHEAIGAVSGRLDRAEQSGRELATTLTDFRGAVGEMAGAETRVAEALDQMRKTSESRERELTEMLASNRRFTTIAMVFCGVGVGIALVVALLSALG